MSKVTIVIDLGYGDAGKGAHVDYLCRTQGGTTVVRFNGGGQAGHNVVTPESIHHEFHHFGAGTFAGAKTFLSKYMLISPMVLMQEAIDLRIKGVPEAFKQMWIDPGCIIVTPFHEAANQLRELARGNGRHGSTGMGIGEAVVDAKKSLCLVANSLIHSKAEVAGRLYWIQQRKLAEMKPIIDQLWLNPEAQHHITTLTDLETVDAIADFYVNTLGPLLQFSGPNFLKNILKEEHVVFEGAQGVLLDEVWGFWPHTTWSSTTRKNADILLEESGYEGDVICHGLTRAYATRHGRGPFPTEDAQMTKDLPDKYNPFNPWQEGFRAGHLDSVTLDYAISANGPVDGIVISCLDQLRGRDIKMCSYYLSEGSLPLVHIPWPFENEGDQPTDVSTKFLESVIPHYIGFGKFESTLEDLDHTSNPIEVMCRSIEDELDIPVIMLSFGETSEDRKERVRV